MKRSRLKAVAATLGVWAVFTAIALLPAAILVPLRVALVPVGLFLIYRNFRARFDSKESNKRHG